MTKQELINHLKHRISYTTEEQFRYENMHQETGKSASIWSEMAEWHKGRACAYNVALELIEDHLEGY